MSKTAKKVRSARDTELARKAKRAVERAKLASDVPGANEASVAFNASGCRDTSIRGEVEWYLLSRECGEHAIDDIARALARKGVRSYKTQELVDAGDVSAAISHLVRRARYNAKGVGFRIVRAGRGYVAVEPYGKARKPETVSFREGMQVETTETTEAA